MILVKIGGQFKSQQSAIAAISDIDDFIEIGDSAGFVKLCGLLTCPPNEAMMFFLALDPGGGFTPSFPVVVN